MTAVAVPRRRTTPLGEAAGLVLTDGCVAAQALARALRAEHHEGIEDVVPAANSVGLLVDPERTSLAEVLELAARLAPDDAPRPVRQIELDVCFDGPDCGLVAASAGLAVDDVVAELAATPLAVGWLGFMPGFPYLVGLREPLASVPRLERPRTQVGAGSFALAGGCAGIYPRATPGGWNVLGRTAIELFDAGRPDPATLAPGDVVRVQPVEALTPPAGAAGRERLAITASGPRQVSVLEAGTRSLVQDRGRLGLAHLGVPRAGPADPLRHCIANLAVGNAEACATLEVTASGPSLRFGCDAFVALVGDCALCIDGREMPPSSVQLVERGQTVSIGTLRRGLHAYLGISGGIETPPVLGSRSSDATSGLWPGPLRPGDELGLGPAGRARGRWLEPPARRGVLSVEAGPDGAGDPARAETFRALLQCEWEVATESDRVGTRLRPRAPDAPVRPAGASGVPSSATVTGAVQLPPDGCPVVLGPDHGTVGGYPVIAVVSRASLSEAGQLRPGDAVRFEEGGPLREAVASQARRLIAGWMSTDLDG